MIIIPTSSLDIETVSHKEQWISVYNLAFFVIKIIAHWALSASLSCR